MSESGSLANPKVRARRAEEADEDFIRSVFYAARAPEFEVAGISGEQLDVLLAQQYSAMRAYYRETLPGTVYEILELGGEAIGYEATRIGEEIHLIDIALLPEFRNRGIGTERLMRLQSMGKESVQPVILSVEIFNPAKRLYERLGFTVTEEAGIYVRMRWLSGTAAPQ